MATYKTPNVYIEEISNFPPSVAQVPTAIPAFIGYTEKAKETSSDDLLMEPKEISSLVEYKSIFGEGPSLDNVDVMLDDNNAPVDADLESKFYLYDSLRLFFQNGGGRCYIISIGNYQEDPKSGFTDFKNGLGKLEKVDEPTIISFPDAVLLPDDKFYNLQQLALGQCNKLKDRVLLCDLKNSGKDKFDEDVDSFRSGIGINNLKYGAAYAPWLKSSLPKNVNFRDLNLKREDDSGNNIELKSLTNDDDLRNLIGFLKDIVGASDWVQQNTIKGKSLKSHFQQQVDNYKSKAENLSSIGDFRDEVRKVYDIITNIEKSLFDFEEQHVPDTIDDSDDLADVKKDFKNTFKNLVTDNPELKEQMQKLLYHSNAFHSTPIITQGTFDDISLDVENKKDGGPIDDEYSSASEDMEKGDLAIKAAKEVFPTFNAVVNELVKALKKYEQTLDDSLRESFGLYKSILEKVNSTLSALPPSGAIAGIYAYVDKNRGVHKAPANVSISGISGFAKKITSDEQKSLNVDVNAGKSINALRTFTGKGHLVWGARTLAGNDNEWRYVPVRRFYNMVEESVKKSTHWAVFEPNTAETWVKVQTMIENYLTDKWREGALAGAKPKQAFFVKVGLGLTMTQQDILEGRMNVEIGMAVVRPAEFIVLKFSHKMQES